MESANIAQCRTLPSKGLRRIILFRQIPWTLLLSFIEQAERLNGNVRHRTETTNCIMGGIPVTLLLHGNRRFTAYSLTKENYLLSCYIPRRLSE